MLLFHLSSNLCNYLTRHLWPLFSHIFGWLIHLWNPILPESERWGIGRCSIELQTSCFSSLFITILDQSKTFAQLGMSFPDILLPSLTVKASTIPEEHACHWMNAGMKCLRRQWQSIAGRRGIWIIAFQPTRTSLNFHAVTWTMVWQMGMGHGITMCSCMDLNNYAHEGWEVWDVRNEHGRHI